MTKPDDEQAAPAAGAQRASSQGSSYGQILKSSALIGSATAANVLMGIVRNKVMALLLGPSGYGLMGLYMAVLDVAQSLASLGIGASAVREIAAAAGAGDQQRVARVASVLRKMSIVLGVLGAVLLALGAVPVARLTFGDDAHAWGVAAVSAALLFRLVGLAQTALLQGLRRMGDLARSGILGGALGTVASVAIIAILGEDGIVASVVAVAIMGVVASWWYTRRLRLVPAVAGGVAFRQEAEVLLRLGVVMMVSAFLGMGTSYASRIFVVHAQGVEAAGLYQAAWTLAGLYIGFVMQAMGMDFLPRLAAASHDKESSNRLINEQTQVGLLFAGPGLLATLLAAPLVLHLIFSERFVGADHTLRWLCVGMAMRTVSWPLGFALMVHASRRAYITMDLIWAAVDLGLSWLLVDRFGAPGVGAAFVLSYLVYIGCAYPIVRSLTGFRWTGVNARLMAVNAVALAVVFAARSLLPQGWGLAIGVAAFVPCAFYCGRMLAGLVPAERWPRLIRWLLLRLRLLKA